MQQSVSLLITNESTEEESHRHGVLPTYESNVVITTITSVFLVVGATGSLFTAVLITRRKTLQTKANIFIFSLCLSDLISALICSPLWTYRRTWGFQQWMWGDATCKFYWVSDFSTNYATSLHIVSFSALRYLAVKRPFFVKKIGKRFIICYICFLWIIAVLSASPLAFLMGVDPERENAVRGSCWPACSIASRNGCCIPQYQTYTIVINPIMFYLPQLLIIIFSVLICLEIRRRRKWRERYSASVRTLHSNNATPRAVRKNQTERSKGSPHVIRNTHITSSPSRTSACEKASQNNDLFLRTTNSNAPVVYGHETLQRANDLNARKEMGTCLQLGSIVITYMVGYIPVTVYLLWAASTPTESKGPDTDYWFGVISYLFLRLTECLNPVMYNLGASTMRDETRRTLKSIFSCKREGIIEVRSAT